MLLDQFLPIYHFSEHHACKVHASPAVAFRQAKQVDMGTSPLIKALTMVRMLPHSQKAKSRTATSGPTTFDDFVDMGFIRLAEASPDEIVLGLVGQFWKPAAQLVNIAPDNGYWN